MIIVVLNPILVLTDWPLKYERFTFCPWHVGNKNWSSKFLRFPYNPKHLLCMDVRTLFL